MQTIEALAKEKGIEAETIITAIEDAVLTASRKYYKTNENLKTRFNQETGQVDLFAIKHIVRRDQPTRPRSRSRKRRSSTARRRKSTWRSSSRSAPTCSGASRRRRPSR